MKIISRELLSQKIQIIIKKVIKFIFAMKKKQQNFSIINSLFRFCFHCEQRDE